MSSQSVGCVGVNTPLVLGDSRFDSASLLRLTLVRQVHRVALSQSQFSKTLVPDLVIVAFTT